MDWPSAIYAAINKGQAFTAPEIKDKSILIGADIDATLENLAYKKWYRGLPVSYTKAIP